MTWSMTLLQVTLKHGYSFDHDLTLYIWYNKQQDPHVIHEKGDPQAGL